MEGQRNLLNLLMFRSSSMCHRQRQRLMEITKGRAGGQLYTSSSQDPEPTGPMRKPASGQILAWKR